MRDLVLGATALALATLASPLVNPASAVEYPYCATGGSVLLGGCSFATLEQCRTFVQGGNGHCVANARFTSATNEVARTTRPRR